MSFTNRLNEVIEESRSALSELIDDFGENIPNYNERGLNVEIFEILLDGRKITHITNERAYDERGLITNIEHIILFHLEDFLLAIDHYSNMEKK